LNETCVWLKIVQRSAMLPAVELTSLQRECRELGRIINASIATAKANRK
jgi:hypothetical protein